MKKTILYSTVITLLICTLWSCNTKAPVLSEPVFELQYEADYTPSWYEAIEMYEQLDKASPLGKLLTYGNTDSGKPLHLFVISKDRDFNPESLHRKGKAIYLINNGIHPGEPAGIDASLQLAQDILMNKDGLLEEMDNVVLAIIPIYNIGGALKRSAFHRANQVGPELHGHRGNARNLDLNRDFAKMDTRNARSFAGIVHEWKPDILLDTHTTNGSDHQYSITVLMEPRGVLAEPVNSWFKDKMVPWLYEDMATGEYELIPYVQTVSRSRDIKDGIGNYVQGPRYSSGFAYLFNIPGFITENHVYKRYADRVKSVHQFMISSLSYLNQNATELKEVRAKANEEVMKQKTFPIAWQMNPTRADSFLFKGYELTETISPISGLPVRSYNHDDPWEKTIPYYDDFVVSKTIEAPDAYLIPQAWEQAIERLKINQVQMERLEKDTSLKVEVYYFENLDPNRTRLNNGHRYYSGFSLRSEIQTLKFYEGDYLVPMNQLANRYIVEMLEPLATDSFFRWNLFDPCLETREYFGGSGWEVNALNYLESHPDFKAQFEQAKKDDPELAKNHWAQLRYIYMNTEWQEEMHMRYPVARLTY